MAKTTRLTPELITLICEHLRAGMYAAQAARAAGVAESTYYYWLERGRKEEEGPYAEFVTVVERAEAEAESFYLTIIRAATGNSWQAAAWWLERRFPSRWGRRFPQVEAEQKPGQTGDFNPSTWMSDFLTRARERIKEREEEEAAAKQTPSTMVNT